MLSERLVSYGSAFSEGFPRFLCLLFRVPLLPAADALTYQKGTEIHMFWAFNNKGAPYTEKWVMIFRGLVVVPRRYFRSFMYCSGPTHGAHGNPQIPALWKLYGYVTFSQVGFAVIQFNLRLQPWTSIVLVF
jgi:hypothetical protein